MWRYYFLNSLNEFKNLILGSIPIVIQYVLINIVLGIVTAFVIGLINIIKRKMKFRLLTFILISILLLFECIFAFAIYSLYGVFSLVFTFIIVVFIIVDNV